jgi:hypothetical protein
MVGHPVSVYSDNKAFSFLRRCILASERVTRWMMQLQAYNLNTVHISRTNNIFADKLSRNPVVLGRKVFVAKIDWNIDNTVKEKLEILLNHHST